MRAALRRLGFDVIRWPAGSDYGVTLTGVLREAAIDVTIDAGAHRGDWAAGLRRLGFVGRIISYEPSPDSFAALAGHAASDSLWDVRPVALGDREGVSLLNVAANSEMSSLHAMADWWRSSRTDAVVEKTVSVPVVRLADEWPPGNVFLKVDTQGADMAVIRGCGERIADVHVIQVELAMRPAYDGQEGYVEALATLSDNGFVPVGFFTFLRGEGLRLLECDCILRRRIET